MTRYTVVWHGEAQDQLTQIWIDASDRNAITGSANSIDSILSHVPESKGTAVEGELLELTVPPLRVLYAVIEMDRIARVVNVEFL